MKLWFLRGTFATNEHKMEEDTLLNLKLQPKFVWTLKLHIIKVVRIILDFPNYKSVPPNWCQCPCLRPLIMKDIFMAKPWSANQNPNQVYQGFPVIGLAIVYVHEA